MNPLSPQTSGELIPSPVFLATCFLFIPNSLTLNLICETHMNLCILYPPPFLQIYDVLELRSTRCSDIHIDHARNRRTGSAPSLRSSADCRAHPKYESTIHMRPPLAIRGSVAAWLNIVFNHCCILSEHQELLSPKHIYIYRNGDG